MYSEEIVTNAQTKPSSAQSVTCTVLYQVLKLRGVGGIEIRL